MLADMCTAPINNDSDIHTGPILILPEFLDQRLTRERRPSRMQLTQFRPGENDAVTVDNKIPPKRSTM